MRYTDIRTVHGARERFPRDTLPLLFLLDFEHTYMYLGDEHAFSCSRR